MRNANAPDRYNSLYTRHTEAWLEAQIRNNIEAIDVTLIRLLCMDRYRSLPEGTESILDLLAVDRTGRLAVIEVKPTRIFIYPSGSGLLDARKVHQERSEFAKFGFFPGISLRPEPPRLLLVAPALDWHPSNEGCSGTFRRSLTF